MVNDLEVKAIGPWVAGVGAVIFVTGLVKFIWPDWPQWNYFSVILMSCGLPVLVAYTTYFLVWVGQQRPPAPKAAPPIPPDPPAQPAPDPVRLVPFRRAGETTLVEMPARRSARQMKWQRFSEELRVWYLAKGSLLSGDLVGKGRGHAFSDAEAWGLALAEWDRVGLASKANGKPTVLTVTDAELALALARGNVAWTDEHDPPAIRPAPTEEVLQHRPTTESPANG